MLSLVETDGVVNLHIGSLIDKEGEINIDYYTVFLIPALISARVDCISLSPKGEG